MNINQLNLLAKEEIEDINYNLQNSTIDVNFENKMKINDDIR